MSAVRTVLGDVPGGESGACDAMPFVRIDAHGTDSDSGADRLDALGRASTTPSSRHSVFRPTTASRS